MDFLSTKASLLPGFGSPTLVNLWVLNICWCLVVYLTSGVMLTVYFRRAVDVRHITHSVSAIPFYAILPTACERLVLDGYTRAYTHTPSFLTGACHTLAFVFCTEFGVYFIHRILHANKTLYRWIHRSHHRYSSRNKLGPFAGLAFHPMDGLLQALPYALTLFVVPINFVVFEILLFLTGLWTAFIHTPEFCGFFPLLGPQHHLKHHLFHNKNYGQYTIGFDFLFGTLA